MGLLPGCICYIHLQSPIARDQESVPAWTTTSRLTRFDNPRFKIKLKELINDIHKKHILGHTIVGIYVIECQKRGLPHAHILIFFAEDYKPHTVEDVDCMISAKLPNLEINKLAHKMVARCMMHGPCGAAFPNAPCMEDGECKTQYPCKFQSKTVTDVNEYPIY